VAEDKSKRRIRTPAEKASEALDVHERKIKRIDDAIAHQRAILTDYEAQRTALQGRLDYLLSNPDLPNERRDRYQEQSDLVEDGDGPGA